MNDRIPDGPDSRQDAPIESGKLESPTKPDQPVTASPISEPDSGAASGRPKGPFELLMDLVGRLPQRLQLPTSFAIILVAGLGGIWTMLPEPKRDILISFFGSPHSGAALFPSVEIETAEYKIAITPTGGAVWDLHFRFRRLRPTAAFLADTISTSGKATPIARSTTHDNPQVIRDAYNPKKQPNLNRYVVTLDISKEPLNTTVPAQITYVVAEGFGNAGKEWAGILILQPTRKATVRIDFQPAKMGRKFQFETYSWSADESSQPFASPKFNVLQKENALLWEIESPHLNQVYSVNWEW